MIEENVFKNFECTVLSRVIASFLPNCLLNYLQRDTVHVSVCAGRKVTKVNHPLSILDVWYLRWMKERRIRKDRNFPPSAETTDHLVIYVSKYILKIYVLCLEIVS